MHYFLTTNKMRRAASQPALRLKKKFCYRMTIYNSSSFLRNKYFLDKKMSQLKKSLVLWWVLGNVVFENYNYQLAYILDYAITQGVFPTIFSQRESSRNNAVCIVSTAFSVPVCCGVTSYPYERDPLSFRGFAGFCTFSFLAISTVFLHFALTSTKGFVC